MKEITKLLGQIDYQVAAIARLQDDWAACEVSINGECAHVEKIEALKAQRRTLSAEALVRKKAVNTATLDARIESAVNLHNAALASGEVARDAIVIIAEGIEIGETELENLRGELAQAVGAELMTRHDCAMRKYLDAVASLEEGVTDLAAVSHAWGNADPSLRLGKFPGKSETVLDGLRSAGVKVPWSESRLADPKVAAEYSDDFRNYMFPPKWVDARSLGLGDEQAVKLVDELRQAGLPFHPISIAQQPLRPKQVKVRVIRGTIPVLGLPVRHPGTDQIISTRSTSYRPGDDCLLDESDARRFREAGLVLIHDLDTMPEPPPPASEPRRIDARAGERPQQVIDLNIASNHWGA